MHFNRTSRIILRNQQASRNRTTNASEISLKRHHGGEYHHDAETHHGARRVRNHKYPTTGAMMNPQITSEYVPTKRACRSANGEGRPNFRLVPRRPAGAPASVAPQLERVPHHPRDDEYFTLLLELLRDCTNGITTDNLQLSQWSASSNTTSPSAYLQRLIHTCGQTLTRDADSSGRSTSLPGNPTTSTATTMYCGDTISRTHKHTTNTTRFADPSGS